MMTDKINRESFGEEMCAARGAQLHGDKAGMAHHARRAIAIAHITFCRFDSPPAANPHLMAAVRALLAEGEAA
jgi:hypothetical protein